MQTRVTPEEYKEFLSLGHGDIFSLDTDRVVDPPWRCAAQRSGTRLVCGAGRGGARQWAALRCAALGWDGMGHPPATTPPLLLLGCNYVGDCLGLGRVLFSLAGLPKDWATYKEGSATPACLPAAARRTTGMLLLLLLLVERSGRACLDATCWAETRSDIHMHGGAAALHNWSNPK